MPPGGAEYEEVPTRIVKPTRRCSGCAAVKHREDMPLHQRMYACAACGFTLKRDRNVCQQHDALVIGRALVQRGR